MNHGVKKSPEIMFSLFKQIRYINEQIEKASQEEEDVKEQKRLMIEKIVKGPSLAEFTTCLLEEMSLEQISKCVHRATNSIKEKTERSGVKNA